jgi:hypothetical protein
MLAIEAYFKACLDMIVRLLPRAAHVAKVMPQAHAHTAFRLRDFNDAHGPLRPGFRRVAPHGQTHASPQGAA